MTSIEKRVRRGARLLDRVRPGWADAIDAGTLSMHSSSKCVLGQLFGDYSVGRDKLIRPANVGYITFLRMTLFCRMPISWYFGFIVWDDIWWPSRDCWLAEIASRRTTMVVLPTH